MYIVTLSLTAQKSRASEFMAAHNAWIARGFDEGAFLLVGSLKPQGGGAILAAGSDRAALEQRIADDPFVQEGIAIPEIQEVAPARTDERLSFLTAAS
ncbi:hypothetical protein PVW51_08125 [Sulfitobacter sp. PR48]|uniref:YciI family protein n=1 Tax=Sulfitobacter sp. PR48 TaxID=3028383 RepID=UPI00237A214C|nr:YciI family protein [Sulfitobacter sp. PR48]MDD9720657.1 hypothetical protein [Sulfitobacter sp. PR48]